MRPRRAERKKPDMLKGTWEIHVRQTELMLGYLSNEQLAIKPEGSGRSIGAVLVHLVNNRIDWLEPIAPALMEGIVKVSQDQKTELLAIQETYIQTSAAVGRLIGQSMKFGGKVKGFQGNINTFIGYLIAHEWYHIGEIGVILGQMVQAIPKNKAYDLWDWRDVNY